MNAAGSKIEKPSSQQDVSRRKSGGRQSTFTIRGQVLFGSAAMALLILVIGGWAATAQLTSAIIAPGTIVVERHVKKVQHRDGGIVSEINVENGDLVEAGQILIRIDETQIRAELGIVHAQMIELIARSARLAAESNGAREVNFPDTFYTMEGDAKKIAAGEVKLFKANKSNQDSRRAQYRLQIEQLDQEIAGIKAQRDGKRGQLDLIERELKQIRILYKKKLTSVGRVYSMEREAKRLWGEHGGLLAQTARAKGKISEIHLQILSIDQTVRAGAQRELRSIEAQLAELRQREVASVDRLKRCNLRAPLSGFVHELAVHTIGGVIVSAEPVMLIVPKDELLAVEVRFSPVDIDQIVIGRKVKLRFSAFDQKTTPEIDGSVSSVSADIASDGDTGQSFYRGRIEIDKKFRDQFNALKLLPGMPVEAFISTGNRTALSYLLKPVTDQFHRAFREN